MMLNLFGFRHFVTASKTYVGQEGSADMDWRKVFGTNFFTSGFACSGRGFGFGFRSVSTRLFGLTGLTGDTSDSDPDSSGRTDVSGSSDSDPDPSGRIDVSGSSDSEPDPSGRIDVSGSSDSDPEPKTEVFLGLSGVVSESDWPEAMMTSSGTSHDPSKSVLRRSSDSVGFSSSDSEAETINASIS
jgi:hypothetical protein